MMSIKLPHTLFVDGPIIAVVPKRSAIADLIGRTGSGYALPVDGNWREGKREILHGKCLLPQGDQRAIEVFPWAQSSQEWLNPIGAAERSKDKAMGASR